MSDAVTVTCPSCKATCKLKNSNSVGKKVPCPKCKKPFVVKAPPAEDDELAFMDASESDGAVAMAEEDEDEFAAALPAKSTSRAAGGKKAKKGKSKSSSDANWVKPLLIGAAALVFVGLLVGGGIVAVSMIGGQVHNKIDLTYLPPDAEFVIHVRVDEVFGSPFVQPLLANATAKQQLDQLSNEYGVAPGDMKTVTIGVAGSSDLSLSNLAAPGMGMPGTARPRAGTGAEKTRTVVVIRMSKPLNAEKVTKITGYTAAEHQGKTYYRPVVNPMAARPVVYLAAADVLLVADEVEIHRIIEKGSKQTRRAEFDFVDTTPQILVAAINKNASAAGMPPGGGAPGSPPMTTPAGMQGPGAMPGMPGAMPGAMPGMPGAAPNAGGADLASLSKVKAWYAGITFTQDVDLQSGFYSPDTLPEVQADLEKLVAKLKSEFQTAKTTQLAMLPVMGLADLIPNLEATVNSFRVSGSGSVAQLHAKIPGAIKGSIEKGMALMSNMAAGAAGMPGDPNQFGAQPPTTGDAAPPTIDAPTGTANSTGNPQ